MDCTSKQARVSAGVRALAFHQLIVQGSEVPFIRGVNLFDLYSAAKGFFLGYSRFSPLTKNRKLDLICCDSV